MTERRRLVPPPDPDRPTRLPAPGDAPLFAGRTALVTGGAGGIGRGIAEALAAHGARILLVDIDPTAAAATADRITAWASPQAAPETVIADVTDPAALGTIMAAAQEIGGVDLLVNNVGDYRPSGTFVASGPADWDRAYALNFGHVLALTHAVLPGMIERRAGAVLNVSSVEGMRGIPGNAVYGALKAAVCAFTASLASEVGQYGIRVNCLAPDLTDTDQTAMWDSTDEKYADHVGKWVPVGRFGHRVDHGDAAVFLLSDQSAFVTGVTLRVDGGTLASAGWFRRDTDHFTNMPRPLR